MSGSNPLSARPKAQDHPAMAHAKMWQHVSSIPAHKLPGMASQMDGLLPVFGALAGNPNVKAKDVIRAAADASARGLASPSEAVKFISSMPSEPDKLQPWLRGVYEANLSAQVHMKAAMAQQAQGAPQAAPQPMPGTMP